MTAMPNVELLLLIAEQALAADEVYRARVTFEAALEIDPGNVVARIGIEEIDRELRLRLKRNGIGPRCFVELSTSYDDVGKRELPVNVAVLVDLLGSKSRPRVQELIDESSLSTPAAVEALLVLIDTGAATISRVA